MINLNQLRVFYEAGKHLNFTGAAGNLCITQPAVAAQGEVNAEIFMEGITSAYTGQGRTCEVREKSVFDLSKKCGKIRSDDPTFAAIFRVSRLNPGMKKYCDIFQLVYIY